MFNRIGLLMLGFMAVVLGAGIAVAEEVAPVTAPVASSEPSKFRLGALFGLNASTVICDGCEAAGVTGRLGLGAGAVAEYVIVDKFSIEMELMYLQKGARVKDNLNLITDYINYNTLEIPISAKGRFGNDKVKGIVFGGPQIGFALTRSTQASGAANSVALDAATVDFGVHVGGGAEFTVAHEVYLFVNGRINVGLTDVKGAVINQKSTTFGVLGTTGVKFGL